MPHLNRVPDPFPVFNADEDDIIAWGYPVQRSEGIRRLKVQLERQIGRELEFLHLDEADLDDRRKVVAGRDAITTSLEGLFLNAMLNDYGRSLVEVLLLSLSVDIQRLMAAVPRFLARRTESPLDAARAVRQLASMLGAQILKGAAQAGDRIRKLSDGPIRGENSPFFDLLCRDPLLLVEASIPRDSGRLAFLLSSRTRVGTGALLQLSRTIGERFAEAVQRHPEWKGMVRHVCGGDFRPDGPDAGLEPAFLDLIKDIGWSRDLDLGEAEMARLRDFGIRLKGLELVAIMRNGIIPVGRDAEGRWTASIRGRTTTIAASTRPYDFTAHGVVDSAVFRFGLIYDLTNFTAVLQEVRKAGRTAEEQALQFMYVFQSRTEEIRVARRLIFEKFLGDGAFFSARRASRVLAAAIEIQSAYDQLRQAGFPFDQGLRIAVNAAEYRLLPMGLGPSGQPAYEFFGHGIVELARLTTGKSTREVAQVAELLVHAGYDPEEVDEFLRPLIEARVSKTGGSTRPYQVSLDSHGDLINEGIVVTLAFIKALAQELDECAIWEGSLDEMRWLVINAVPGGDTPVAVGLRMLGVARLKGLAPVELVEAIAWPETNSNLKRYKGPLDLVESLRRVGGHRPMDDEAEAADVPEIPDDVVVISFEDASGVQRWIIGSYRTADDVVVHALSIPLVVPDDAGSTEMWLFKSRFELSEMYQVLQRESSGVSQPMSQLREQRRFQAWFLAAPHRAP